MAYCHCDRLECAVCLVLAVLEDVNLVLPLVLVASLEHFACTGR